MKIETLCCTPLTKPVCYISQQLSVHFPQKYSGWQWQEEGLQELEKASLFTPQAWEAGTGQFPHTYSQSFPHASHHTHEPQQTSTTHAQEIKAHTPRHRNCSDSLRVITPPPLKRSLVTGT